MKISLVKIANDNATIQEKILSILQICLAEEGASLLVLVGE